MWGGSLRPFSRCVLCDLVKLVATCMNSCGLARLLFCLRVCVYVSFYHMLWVDEQSPLGRPDQHSDDLSSLCSDDPRLLSAAHMQVLMMCHCQCSPSIIISLPTMEQSSSGGQSNRKTDSDIGKKWSFEASCFYLEDWCGGIEGMKCTQRQEDGVIHEKRSRDCSVWNTAEKHAHSVAQEWMFVCSLSSLITLKWLF